MGAPRAPALFSLPHRVILRWGDVGGVATGFDGIYQHKYEEKEERGGTMGRVLNFIEVTVECTEGKTEATSR